jgi:hypothetical protein
VLTYWNQLQSYRGDQPGEVAVETLFYFLRSLCSAYLRGMLHRKQIYPNIAVSNYITILGNV